MSWMHAIFSESASEWVQARSSTLQHKAAGIRGITIMMCRIVIRVERSLSGLWTLSPLQRMTHGYGRLIMR